MISESWSVLLERRKDLIGESSGLESQEEIMKRHLEKIRGQYTRTQKRILSIENDLKLLGWEPE